ncbi:high-affinity Zn(2+) transporter zrt1 [Didymosphaeria variabile]|uniref:High-affinity Zn(2+) transporter zrt1 n=1 Tax=Didymosphaeria variabile TaxID=1932322 RepID=A0A9W9CA17_9PLEO|nr:high-affinity Zn(2+) transporter zrt1 [Didymosphaeria variabile]KAJ4351940.1 high-affinity Zn(2+) transporter zrt1 [Didymosphaeria variabile]
MPELPYEATTAAIFMAGLFLSFLVDYISKRFLLWRQSKRSGQDAEATAPPTGDAKTASPANSAVITSHGSDGHVDLHSDADAKINVLVLEAGIIFHSLLIGITLVVSGDAFFITLFIVILFHQMFEGLALGTCIAALPPMAASMLSKCLMAAGFTLVTPIGMAIGIGVLDKFNGSDPSTLIAIGTLDALSAGILAWVGIHEMLARDWLHGGLVSAGVLRTGVAMFCLIAGMAIMSLLGKWA